MHKLKYRKDKSNKGIKKMEGGNKDEKSIVESILGDISKSTATQQLVLGSTSGWVTGFIFMKVGKAVALTVGGGIILLEIAKENGYVKVNWSKVNKNVDKVVDKVEEKITGEGPSWMDKIGTFAKSHMSFSAGFVGGFFIAMERFVDRKIDKAEDLLKHQQGKAKRWYMNQKGESHFRMRESYIFIASFVAGVCIGLATS